jgi:ribonucleoside-triphosphate reductase
VTAFSYFFKIKYRKQKNIFGKLGGFFSMKNIKVIKKNGNIEDYEDQKIINAITKSAERVMVDLTNEDYLKICDLVIEIIYENNLLNEDGTIDVNLMHNVVEEALETFNPKVSKSYKDYRNYKKELSVMMDDVFKGSQKIKYLADKSNANTDSALVSTQRCLIYNKLNKELYQKFNLTAKQSEAIKDGYIYIHDISARRDTFNCCLFDIQKVLDGGFEMSNLWYNEPKSIDTAFDVLGDIILSSAAQQYGGFSCPELDKVLDKYCKKSYTTYYYQYVKMLQESMGVEFYANEENKYTKVIDEYATKQVIRDIEQGVQGLEYKLNTVSSSRGDFPFTTVSFGLGEQFWEKEITKAFLKVRMNGQGKKGFEKPVLFPKLIFLYDENKHGENKVNNDLFELAVESSSQCMYPDYVSLSSKDDDFVTYYYQKYKTPITPMGCRSFLSPWWKNGGIKPLDNDDTPIFTGRGNIGVVSLNLPMIYQKSVQENKDYYEILDYYLEMIRNIHKTTMAYLGELKASCNPLGFCQGGFYNGYLKPDDKIKEVVKTFTASFGITALNELCRLYNGKSIIEDNQIAINTMTFINSRLDKYKEEDGILYGVYGTPSESLCGTQVEQFRMKYGIIPNVSDKDYMTNSFHCHVSEDITPIEKQNYEKEFWKHFKGGRIQYVRINKKYNKNAVRMSIKRGMDLGFYQGINLQLVYCEDCGHEFTNNTTGKCEKCGSDNITVLDRVCGYLGYSTIKNDTKFNKAKLSEVKDRKSM